MTYKETLEYLYNQLPVYHRIGKAAYKADLHNSILLDEYFGRPHKNFVTVHVAGTNGKGSVSHMLASILQEAGFKTGLYTSPHLLDYRERIRINGEMISEEEVVSFVDKNHDFIVRLKPSFFEMSVAMAFNHFSESNVDLAVIETGLGGRLDSTNIISPVLSVITNIGMDHMDLLGNSIEAIASEKAGIIKNGIPVVIGERDIESEEVFRKTAEKNSADLVFASDNYILQWNDNNVIARSGLYSLYDRNKKLVLQGASPLTGDYQEKNIATVYASVTMLRKTMNISDENIVSGICNVTSNTGLMGRWQIVGEKPVIICDTGHNSHGLKYVTNQLTNHSKGKLHIVCGFVSDKALELVLPLFPTVANYYFAKASVERALDSRILQSEAEKYGLRGNAFDSVQEAISEALNVSREEDIIFIGGSTFVVADALIFFRSNNQDKLNS